MLIVDVYLMLLFRLELIWWISIMSDMLQLFGFFVFLDSMLSLVKMCMVDMVMSMEIRSIVLWIEGIVMDRKWWKELVLLSMVVLCSFLFMFLSVVRYMIMQQLRFFYMVSRIVQFSSSQWLMRNVIGWLISFRNLSVWLMMLWLLNSQVQMRVIMMIEVIMGKQNVVWKNEMFGSFFCIRRVSSSGRIVSSGMYMMMQMRQVVSVFQNILLLNMCLQLVLLMNLGVCSG